MRGLFFILMTAIVVFLPADIRFHLAAADGITAEQVEDSIKLGVKYLRRQQHPKKGSWQAYSIFDTTSLCTLALLNSGVPVEDPAIQNALSFLREAGNPEMTYTTALQTMVFATAEPARDRLLIERNVKWLEAVQVTGGDSDGGWGYSEKRSEADPSNTQFALLALYEAQQAGVAVREQVWRRSLNYWQARQRADGSWGYKPEQSPSGSMTCAGLASLMICSGSLSAGDAMVKDGRVFCCNNATENEELARGLRWIARHYSVRANPGVSGTGAARTSHYFYYMYGLERVGRLSGRRFFEKHDWYREGAERIISLQDRTSGYWIGIGIGETNREIATALSLLFLAKGARPVILGKLVHSLDDDEIIAKATPDWDRHRAGAQHLTNYVSEQWKRDLTWQSIDSRAATVDDLLQAPVLFISGRDDLALTDEQVDNLREYVNRGGFIFAERACGGDGFDLKLRDLAKRLFPDSAMRLLPADHPVWFAEAKTPAKFQRKLYGVDACCRTSLIYCDGDLSCYWELDTGGRKNDYPEDVQAEIQATLDIGRNVLAYATNRELKPKIRESIAAATELGQPTRSTLRVPKLSHSGGSDDAPSAVANLLRLVSKQLEIRIDPKRDLIAPDDQQLFEYPLVYVHGRKSFQWTDAQRKNLADYLERGGVIFGDSICASASFSKSFRQEIKGILPEAELVRLAADHPIFSDRYRGFDLSTVTIRSPRGGAGGLSAKLAKTRPELEGVILNGRLVVVFSPNDLSCALENSTSFECKGYIKEDAERIGANVVLYALQQ